ncbi:hypothetical protein INT44_002347 [Umbelopsis vinacea]|uniref:BZIP domain-containing protein n=1 Tax=Umbelopsis vinacea TaxID=44442 RepID=A0A8H7Q5T2_9FUNG|nr:hypothetical protein INT44_002347 [Umbelopsis vinacea]KAI9285111.1 hypothetical protein BC943DRAFT_278379 [Umbelopsis sp. AD052]
MSLLSKPQVSTTAFIDAATFAADQVSDASSDSVHSEDFSAANADSPSSDSPSEHINPKKRKHTLEDKDQKQRERILRNRAAAQDSRDRKRRYISNLETDNQQLKEQNEELNKRLQSVETENEVLSAQLRMFVTQLSQVQDQLRFNNITEFLLGGFRDSARVALRTPQSYCV